MDQIEAIVREVLLRLQNGTGTPGTSGTCNTQKMIPAEMSGRHVHLSPEDLRALFGIDKLECVRELSQPGQFLSGSRVRLIGPKGILDNVAVLGPTRSKTQVEISATDARALGINAPVRLSGELADAAEVCIQAGGTIICRKAAIVAKRHLHMTPADAASLGVAHGQNVSVRVLGSRPLILEDVSVRVSEQSGLALHMDTDEANAAGAGKDCKCQIVGVCRETSSSCCGTVSQEPAGNSCESLPGKLIIEQDIKRLHAAGATSLCVRKDQIITPLARDTAKAYKITLTYGG